MLYRSSAELRGHTLFAADEVVFDIKGLQSDRVTIDELRYVVHESGRFLESTSHHNGIIFRVLRLQRDFLDNLEVSYGGSDSFYYWPEPPHSDFDLLSKIVLRLFDEIERRKDPMLLVAEWVQKVDKAKAKVMEGA